MSKLAFNNKSIWKDEDELILLLLLLKVFCLVLFCEVFLKQMITFRVFWLIRWWWRKKFCLRLFVGLFIIIVIGCCWRWRFAESPVGSQLLFKLLAAQLIFREGQQAAFEPINFFSQHVSQSSRFVTFALFPIKRVQVYQVERILFGCGRTRHYQIKNTPVVIRCYFCLAFAVVVLEIFLAASTVSALDRCSKCSGNENDCRIFYWSSFDHRFCSLMKMIEEPKCVLCKSILSIPWKCESLLLLFYINQLVNQCNLKRQFFVKRKHPTRTLSQHCCKVTARR